MTIAKGATLGPYEIVAHLGSGGMGEVWRARDRRIGRDVAVKVLPDEFAPSADDLKRFEQEARAAGALSHPGLVTIFDVGTVNGAPYIVMELLEGETLRDALGDPEPVALPVRKALDYAIQIASALAVVHEKGIIHRDLKPENLFVTSDRRVKILDFGLAKLAAVTTESGRRMKTVSKLTLAGMAIGTPSYMSPEQVRAVPVDHRTDIFSVGSVLYEMLAGKPAFERESVVETMHAVLNDEAPPIENPELSPEAEATLRHCLEKDPRDRFQSALDLAFHLNSLPEMRRSRSVAPLGRPWWQRAGIIILPLLLLLAAGAFAVRKFQSRPPVVKPRTYVRMTSADGLEIFPTLAPDGKSFAYVSGQAGNRDIYVQRVDGYTGINITADWTDDDSEPAFSPDGSQIAFRSERDGGGIYVMGATGEFPQRLTDFGHNPAWSPDGTKIVIATELIELVPHIRPRLSELWMVDVRTFARRPLVQRGKGGPEFANDSDAVQPSWSPHGKRIAFWSVSLSGLRDIWTIDPDAPEPKRTVVRATSATGLHWNPVWSPDGKYLYYGCDSDGTLNLWRVAIDEESGKPLAAPEAIPLPTAVAGHFAFAKTGELAFISFASSYQVLAMPFDANAGTLGAPRRLFGGSGDIRAYEPSPDGKLIAYATSGTREDLFVTDGMRVRRVTNDPAKDRGLQWSPDGATLYFYSNRGAVDYRIWSVRADGSDLHAVTDEADAKSIGMRILHTPVPSPDGRTLLVQAIPGVGKDVNEGQTSALVHLDRAAKPRVEVLPIFLSAAKWSPDGQLVAARDQREPDEQRLPPNDPPGEVVLYDLRARRRETLSKSGFAPHWTPDGSKVVFFGRQDIRIVDVKTRAMKIVPTIPFNGVPIDFRNLPHMSKDGGTVYVRQTDQQADIWMVRFAGQ